jgi:hypothetical protein
MCDKAISATEASTLKEIGKVINISEKTALFH